MSQVPEPLPDFIMLGGLRLDWHSRGEAYRGQLFFGAIVVFIYPARQPHPGKERQSQKITGWYGGVQIGRGSFSTKPADTLETAKLRLRNLIMDELARTQSFYTNMQRDIQVEYSSHGKRLEF